MTVRLKTIPEDFRVRELLEWGEVPAAATSCTRCTRRSCRRLRRCRSWPATANVDRSAIAYAGLKDRQAVTDQFLTIERRAVELRLPNLRVHPVGTTDRPITSRQSSGNAFDDRGARPVAAIRLRCCAAGCRRS
jgi:tRNA(Glu) U13 pseudouridine synthase TruD